MESVRGPGEVWGCWPPASLFMNPYFPFLLTLPLQYSPYWVLRGSLLVPGTCLPTSSYSGCAPQLPEEQCGPPWWKGSKKRHQVR